MENFQFYSPTEFVFGKDQEDNAGALVKKHGGSNVLIHYGGGSAVRSGLLERVKASLDKAGVKYIELGGVNRIPVILSYMKELISAERKVSISSFQSEAVQL